MLSVKCGREAYLYTALQITCRASAGCAWIAGTTTDLRDLEISYCDEAVLKQLDLLPAELLQVARPDLQWLS